MSSCGSPALTLDCLPLEAVLEALPDVEGRARCMLVCRRLRAAGAGSRRLWRRVAVYGRGISSLATAVRRPPGLHIQELEINGHRRCPGGSCASGFELELLSPKRLSALWTSVTAALHSLRGSLRSLSLCSWADLSVDGWVWPLRHLTQLTIECREGSTCRLTSALGVMGLRELSLSCSEADSESPDWSLDLKPGSVPPSLTALRLGFLELQQLPAAVAAAAPSLVELELSSCDLGRSSTCLAPLSALTALTRVDIIYCGWVVGPLPLPPQLSALRRLRRLHLGDNAGPRLALSQAAADAAFAPLAGLPALEAFELDVSQGPGLQPFPLPLAAPPALTALEARYSRWQLAGSAAFWELAPRLRLLAPDQRAAVLGAAALAPASRLTRLELTSIFEAADPPYPAPSVALLLGVLRQLPALADLAWGDTSEASAMAEVIAGSAECLWALCEPWAERPRLAALVQAMLTG